MEGYRQTWEKVSDINAHRVIDGEHMRKENLFKCYDIATTIFGLEGANIIDLGCGGAFLGVYLFDKKKIGQYTGIDISEKSVLAALNNLARFEKSKYAISLVDERLCNLNTFFADVLFSLSVIQHIPTEKYFNFFLRKINKSLIPSICLQIRKGEKTVFREKPYENHAAILYACITTEKDVSAKLTNYTLHKKSKEYGKGYQYLFYTLEV